MEKKMDNEMETEMIKGDYRSCSLISAYPPELSPSPTQSPI